MAFGDQDTWLRVGVARDGATVGSAVLMRNQRVVGTTQDCAVCWDAAGLGEGGAALFNSIRTGDRVELWADACEGKWRCVVEYAELEVYYAP